MSIAAGPNLASPKDTVMVFKTSGTFTPNFSGNVEVLVVAGGGGGGMDMGGGGGGGGVLSSTSYAVTAGTPITVTVGAGGYGAPSGNTYRTDGVGPQPNGHQFTVSATNGGNSVFGSLTALGGGFGASSYYGYTPNSGIGGTGGSGGGCSGYTHGGRRVVDNGTPGQGFSGGNSGNPDSSADSHYSGGGGGAGQRGADGPNRPNGGNGVLNDILGTRYYWAGGGGGASHPPSSGNGGNGGLGGGGGGASWEGTAGIGDKSGISTAVDGKAGSSQPGGDGAPNTGGGGGGGTHHNTNNKGGEGGSGIVIVRFLTSQGTAYTTNAGVINQRSTIMQFDTANTQKSWKGAPTTNLYPIDTYINWPSQSTHFWNGNSWVVDSTYTDPGAPGPAGVYLGKVRKYTSGALSASWSGNSYAYILKTAPMTSGQNYAMSAYTYLSPTCDIDAIDSSIESASSVGALSGGYTTSYDTAKKGSWQRQGLTGTAAGNVNYIIGYARKYGVTNGAFSGFFMVGGAMVETGVFPTPYTDDTRSNTQAILDLTNINTLTVSNLTYAADNTFSFNGSNSYIQTPITGSFPQISFDFWSFFDDPALNTYSREESILGDWNNGRIHFGTRWGGAGMHWNVNSIWEETPNTNLRYGWNHYSLVWNHNTGEKKVYINSILSSSNTTNGNIVLGDFKIGNATALNYYYRGKIGGFSIYRHALSAAEVKQNFNATRSRYGI